MRITWSLFKKDFKAVTAFPRFEILLGMFTFTFVGMCLSSVVQPRVFTSLIQQGDFARAFQNSFSFFLTSFIFVLPPLLTEELVAGDYERGTLLALVTYPVRRSQVLASKFLASLLFSSAVIITPFLFAVAVGSSFNNLAVDPRMLLGYFAGLMLLSFLLCSVSILTSVLSKRLLVAALAFLGISLCWGIAVAGLAMLLQKSELAIYAYTETVRSLIGLIAQPDGHSIFSREQIVTAVAVQLVISASSLGLAYLFFRRKEFK